MPCPDLGALRASLDDAPGGTPAPLHHHVQGCASCRDLLAELRRNAELAAPAIAMTGPDDPLPPAAVQAALARLEQRRTHLLAARPATGATAMAGDAHGSAGDAPPPAAVAQRRRGGRLARLNARTRAVAAALVAALMLTGLIATPGGRAAAAGFLGQFRSERFEVVSFDSRQSMQLNAVMSELVETGVFTGDHGKVDSTAKPAPARDLAEASQLAGFQVQAVSPSALPRGVSATPERVLVTRAHTVRITFDRDQAIAYFRRNGQPEVKIPERFDGAQLIVEVPAIVVQEYAGADGAPRLLVGKAGTIGLDAAGGASLEELRELVLRLPGLPRQTVARLRGISDWRTTLPLPVPTDQARWQQATVDGAEALSFADRTGRLHALLWQRGGHIWGVAGVIGAGEALDVADSLG
ncbi:MAG TPA: hypothetical protein VFA46_16825 [Actinomycetes bacterium]|jgi:hypothetical protein|nr:hypothetical protein [Actinomycetes bacterium]